MVQLTTHEDRLAEEIRLVVRYKDTQKNLLWISLQDDGSVSVGLLGQTHVFDAFTSTLELEDGARKSYQADWRSTHSYGRNARSPFHAP